jgi:hypothetical protein
VGAHAGWHAGRWEEPGNGVLLAGHVLMWISLEYWYRRCCCRTFLMIVLLRYVPAAAATGVLACYCCCHSHTYCCCCCHGRACMLLLGVSADAVCTCCQPCCLACWGC